MVKVLFLSTVLGSQGLRFLSNWKRKGIRGLHTAVGPCGLAETTPKFRALCLIVHFHSEVTQLAGASSSSNRPGYPSCQNTFHGDEAAVRTKTGDSMSEKEAEEKEKKASVPPSTGPQGTTLLATQVGGHQYGKNGAKMGMLDRGNGIVLKALQPPPRGTRELSLYQTAFDPACQNKDLLELRHFLPPYHGSEVLDDVTFLVMNNIAHSFTKPNVLDLKMGLVSSDPEATEEKRRYEELKYPPRKELGFQLTGMMVHDASSGCPQHSAKAFCRSISADAMLTVGLGKFFGLESGGVRKDVVRGVLEKLRCIERWFQAQRTFAFYSSSLLIIYSSQQPPSAPSTPGGHSSSASVSHTNGGQHQGTVSTSPTAQALLPCPDTKAESLKRDVVEGGVGTSDSGSCVDGIPERLDSASCGRTSGRCGAGQKRARREEEDCPLSGSASQCKVSKTDLAEESAEEGTVGVKASDSQVGSVDCQDLHACAEERKHGDEGVSQGEVQTGVSNSKGVTSTSGTGGKAGASDSKGKASSSSAGLGASPPDPSRVEVRMIDFAHVFPATGKDTNYLFGLHKLISMLEQLLKM